MHTHCDGGKNWIPLELKFYSKSKLAHFLFHSIYVQKKVKISNVKRSQHIKHKKNYARPAKKQSTAAAKNSKSIEKQLSTSKKVFGKPIGQKKSSASLSSSKPLANGRAGKNAKHGKQSKETATTGATKVENGHSTPQASNEMDEEDIRDLMEMIEDEDDELLQRSKRRKKDGPDGSAADADSAGQFEVEHAQQRVTAEKSRKMRTVDLLPIKTKAGELITRQTEVEIKAKPIENGEGDCAGGADDEGGDEFIDSDDDIVNEETNLAGATAGSADKAISTTDLLILREQEVARQKYRIGIICSGILEKPEDKMKNFNALFELMDEQHNDAPNLFSIRKIATMSLLEVFKDILPEYRIGQIDLKTQKGMWNSRWKQIPVLGCGLLCLLFSFSQKDDHGASDIRRCVAHAL